MNLRKIKIKQDVAELMKNVEKASKPEYCRLCGKKTETLCNSHVVPQFILKEIAELGMINYGQTISNKTNYIETKKGIKNAFTFKLMCRECDKDFFSNYESPNVILDFDKLSYEEKKHVLIEIAIKSHLSHLNTKNKLKT